MYTMEKQVTFSEISRSGSVDIAKIADYFQDCASFHSDSLGGGAKSLDEKYGCVWLLASWQIEVDRYPVYGEKIKVCTRPYKFDRVLALRNFLIYDESGAIIARANSNWFLIDTKKGVPIRMKDEIASLYELDEKLEMNYEPRRVPCGNAVSPQKAFTVEPYCIDTNLHMNNAWYIRHGLSYIPQGKQVKSVRAEYKNAVKEGNTVYPYTGLSDGKFSLLLADENREAYAALEFGLE